MCRARRQSFDFVSNSVEFRILGAMKTRLRYLTFLVILSLSFAACSPEADQAASARVNLGDDPVATIFEILEMSDRFDRTDRLIAALREVPVDRPDVLESVMSDLKIPFREFERVLIVTAWAKSDPEAATKWVMRNERDERSKATMFNETVYEWARRDPESLRVDFKVGMYSLSEWDATMLRAYVRGWYDSGKPDLDDFIRDLRGNNDDRQRAISELIKNKLAREGADAAIAWVTTLTGDVKYRGYAYSRLAGDISKTDPLRAVRWCEEICDTKLGEDLPKWIASSWVRKDGAAAMDWIMAQSAESPSVRTGIRASFRRFQITFPEESDAWVEGLSEESRLAEKSQGPIIMYANRQANLNRPDAAMEWTRYIEDAWDRERVFKKIAVQWLRADEEAAEVWLTETTDLDEGVKRELRDGIRKYKEQTEKTRKSLALRPAWFVDPDEVD